MFDILAASYMSASRMEHFLEQDFMHKPPHIARRLRAAHGLGSDDLAERRRHRARPILRPAIRWFARQVATGIGWVGHGLRRAGEFLETSASRSYRREVFPERLCAEC